MASVSELFAKTINDGLLAAQTITNPADKAMALAELAKAMAATGLVKTDAQGATVKAEAAANKEDLKNKPRPRAEKEIHPAPATAPEQTEDTDAWTDELTTKYANELNFINEMVEVNAEEAVNGILDEWSSGQVKTIDDITPANIEAIVTHLESLTQGNQEQTA